MRQTATFNIKVDYENRQTDPDALGEALDRLMETALSTPGILDDYGKVEVGKFEIPSDDGVQIAGHPAHEIAPAKKEDERLPGKTVS